MLGIRSNSIICRGQNRSAIIYCCFIVAFWLHLVKTKQFYLNQTTISNKTQIIGYIDILDTLIIELDFSGGDGTILSIGSRERQKYPVIGLYSNTLYIEFSTILNSKDHFPNHFVFNENQTYHLYFKVNHTHYIIKINESFIINYDQYDSHLKPKNMPISICNQWRIPPSCYDKTVSVKNLEITTYDNSDQHIQKNKSSIHSFTSYKPIYPEPDLILGHIDVLDVVRIEFDITVYGLINGWSNFIMIGSRPNQRVPLFALHPNEPRLHLRMSTLGNGNDGFNIKKRFTINKTHHVYIEISHKRYVVKIDDFIIDERYDQHFTPKNMPIYACASWEPRCSNVKIENLNIRTYNDTDNLLPIQEVKVMDKSITPKPGLIIGSIDIWDIMTIELDIIVHHHDDEQYLSILEIASRDGQRYPLLELTPFQRIIRVTMSTDLTFDDGFDVNADDWTYQLNKIHHIAIKISHTEYIISIDNITYRDYKQFDNHPFEQNLPIYVCGEWHSQCANVTVENLIIKTFNSTTNHELEYIPPKKKKIWEYLMWIGLCSLILCVVILLIYNYMYRRRTKQMRISASPEVSFEEPINEESDSESSTRTFSPQDSTKTNEILLPIVEN